MSYHYLVASLPRLVLDENPPVSLENFIDSAGHLLEETDEADLRRIAHDRAEDCVHPLVRQWVDHDTQLRNAVARIRASRLDAEAGPWLHEHEDFDVATEAAAQDAMNAPNPFEREKRLDAHRWEMAEAIERKDPFGAGALMGFALRLRMAERWDRMTPERGRKVLEDLLETHRETIDAAVHG